MRLLFGFSVLCAGTLVGGLEYDGGGSDKLFANQRTTGLHSILRRNVGDMLEKRDEGITTEEDLGKLNLVKWSTDTVRLCAAKFNSTTTSSNPAGLAGCWNIPLLVKNTGFFSADLRLFQVSSPKAGWKKANKGSFQVRVVYDEMTAVISPRPLEDSEVVASEKGMTDTTLVRPLDAQFVGNLFPSLQSKRLSDQGLKVLVTPKIYVEARASDGVSLSTRVSIGEAQYVNGVFSRTADLSKEAAQKVKDMPFVLPGTRIEIVPAGLYFFSVYIAVGCAIFGWGTFERARYRDEYRKRIAEQGSTR